MNKTIRLRNIKIVHSGHLFALLHRYPLPTGMTSLFRMLCMVAEWRPIHRNEGNDKIVHCNVWLLINPCDPTGINWVGGRKSSWLYCKHENVQYHLLFTPFISRILFYFHKQVDHHYQVQLSTAGRCPLIPSAVLLFADSIDLITYCGAAFWWLATPHH